MDAEPEEIVVIYRQRWEIELLFKQLSRISRYVISMVKAKMPSRFRYG